MSIEFGDDDGAEDAYDDSGADLDPEAVTIRFHEERVLRGDSDLGYWHELTDEQKAVALVIGFALVDRLRQTRNVVALARFVRELREYLEPDAEPHDDIVVIEALVNALLRERTLR